MARKRPAARPDKPAAPAASSTPARDGAAPPAPRRKRAQRPPEPTPQGVQPSARPSALLDTRIIYCGDCLDQLRRLPDDCIDLVYIDPPFNSNRNYEVFWGETKERRAFEDRHASTQAYINYMRPRCGEFALGGLRCSVAEPLAQAAERTAA